MNGHPAVTVRPPYDPEILALEDTQHRAVPTSTEELFGLRKEELQFDASIVDDPSVQIQTRAVPGPRGEIEVKLFSATGSNGRRNRPGIIYIHGGGRVMGNPYVGLVSVIDALKDVDAMIISPAYGRAPEFSGDASAEDCYATLKWVGSHLEELGIDPERLLLAGASAGGGLAAATALMARDRGDGPKLCAQLLVCPMLDDRCNSLSSRQFDSGPRGYYTQWGRYAWRCVLGDAAGKEDGVSYYAAAARAEDLSGLPPAYIDAGSAEPFRDEAVAYAQKLWECGVQADLHIWSGGSHGFELFEAPTWIGGEAKRTRRAWLQRKLTNRSA